MSKAAIICALVGASLGAARGASASVLWGLERDGDIYTLNTTTGAATYVATAPGVAPANEIEINPLNGKAYILYGTTANQNLREIDLATGTLLGTAVPLGAEFGGLEFVAGTLYGSATAGRPDCTRSTSPPAPPALNAAMFQEALAGQRGRTMRIGITRQRVRRTCARRVTLPS